MTPSDRPQSHSPSARASRTRWLVRLLGHAGASVPGLWLVWDAATGGLSFDPVRDITQRTGKDAFLLLVLTLAVSPAIAVTRLRVLAPLSRVFGIWAFAYAALHLLAFVGLDLGFRPGLIADGVLEKRFAVIGLAAFLILAVLAATSTLGQARRLGPMWRRIHRLVYVAAALAMLHYFLAVKSVTREQWIWAIVVGLLLAARLPEVASRLSGGPRGAGDETDRSPTADEPS